MPSPPTSLAQQRAGALVFVVVGLGLATLGTRGLLRSRMPVVETTCAALLSGDVQAARLRVSDCQVSLDQASVSFEAGAIVEVWAPVRTPSAAPDDPAPMVLSTQNPVAIALMEGAAAALTDGPDAHRLWLELHADDLRMRGDLHGEVQGWLDRTSEDREHMGIHAHRLAPEALLLRGGAHPGRTRAGLSLVLGLLLLPLGIFGLRRRPVSIVRGHAPDR